MAWALACMLVLLLLVVCMLVLLAVVEEAYKQVSLSWVLVCMLVLLLLEACKRVLLVWEEVVCMLVLGMEVCRLALVMVVVGMELE
jgi:hypothetical protein